MTEEPKDEEAKSAPTRGGSPRMRSVDPRYSQRNFASRLFPGPSQEMSRQFRQQIEGLLKPETDNVQRRSRGAVDSRSSTAEPLNVATPEDIAQVRDKLDEQNELLRAILASTVDTQTDARSTAQNSRTFAWAGTAIALLTLIATVLSIVAAINAS
ncbi:MAG TPA: hypothetical protein VHZ98_14635 [Galbitalea sp.]|nr:hypothetical protein [Galbitalea sp.]